MFTAPSQTFAPPAAAPSAAPAARRIDDPVAELERLTAEIERDARFFGLLFLITAVGIAAAAVAGVWR